MPGSVFVEGPICGENLILLKMNCQMKNFRPPEIQLKALIKISGIPEGRVYIAREGLVIVGYITIHRPDPYSRWHRHSSVLELGGVEVASDWRGRGVGSCLLEHIFSDTLWEDYIIISTEYSRHWDTDGMNMGIWEYRDMLDKFFSRVGFMPMPTNDPDILEHPANILMARVGSRVDWDAMMRFDDLASGRF